MVSIFSQEYDGDALSIETLRDRSWRAVEPHYLARLAELIEIFGVMRSKELGDDDLSRLLADSYTLYLQTHNFRWNVTGLMFQTLHDLFEQQNTELAHVEDEIAERIRALGQPVSGTYAEFVKLSSIKEVSGVPKANEMIRLQLEGNEAVVRTERSIIAKVED